jgi:trimethylguanosine synthase
MNSTRSSSPSPTAAKRRKMNDEIENSRNDTNQEESEPAFDMELLRTRILRSYKQISVSRKMRKFYARRYQLFTRFDAGILLDNESWFSVTPEAVADHVAHRCLATMNSDRSLTVLDGFCGSGGNTIAFARLFDHVIAADIDFVKLQCAQHNAAIYNAENRISFIMQDFFRLHKVLRSKIDLIFLSPPWGGVDYFHRREKDLSELPLDTFRVYLYCLNELKCPNVVFFLPRNSNLEQIAYMAGPGGCVEIEQNFLGHKLVAISAYYGKLCDAKKYT